jgi:trans-2,3-dihydro-3-hydroxyanthranilate isomerase
MKVRFRLLDVFSEVPFAGNQLCVIPETPEDMSEDVMLAITREINFSETTFVTSARPGGYDVRIFTPEKELPFAGHPTLGTAFTMVSEGRCGSPLVQVCRAGEVPVEVDAAAGSAWMRQLPPDVGREVTDRASVARAAGLEPEDLVDGLPLLPVSTGIPHLMVPVRDEAALRRAERVERLCARVCEDADDVESLYLFAVRGEGDVMARMFDRFVSIGEDPATGSAAGPLGAYLSMHGLAGMPGRATVAQGEMVRRPSFLHVETAPADGSWAIRVGGGVRLMGEGSFEI